MFKRGPLTSAEMLQRKAAAEASARERRGHHATTETPPSIVQGSSGPPSRRAVGLFQQGRERPDTRARRGPWDTRTEEPTVGRINAAVTLHFPKTYRAEQPDPKPKGRPLVAQMLGRTKLRRGHLTPHQDVVVTNPETVAEALRHPAMRAIMQGVVEVVRGHQSATIERAHERGMIPEGTKPSTVVQAYRHAALMAAHKAGLLDYAFAPMDQQTKRALRPLSRFMFYAHRRVFDHLNQGALAHKWAPFREQFGQLYIQRKFGKPTGHERMRMRPLGDRFIKIASLEELEKMAHTDGRDAVSGMAWLGLARQGAAWHGEARQGEARLGEARRGEARLGQAGRGEARPGLAWRGEAGHGTARHGEARLGKARQGMAWRGEARLGKAEQGKARAAASRVAGAALRKAWSHFNQLVGGIERTIDRPLVRAGMAATGLGLGFAGYQARQRSSSGAPTTLPQIPPHLPIKDAAKHVEAHYLVLLGRKRGQIAGAAPPMLGKSLNFSFDLGQDPYESGGNLGGYNTDPSKQLRRAMHPRLRRRAFRLRLNTQRHLRRVLSGGITRQERWQLGATTRPPTFKSAKLSKEIAHYTPHGSPQEHCAKCRHFVAPDRCQRITGAVVAGGWCNQWHALGKGLGSLAVKGLGSLAVGAGRALRRAPVPVKVAAGLGAGLALPPAVQALHNDSRVRAIAGAAVVGGAAALLSRGRALRVARLASRKIYTAGLKDAVREHARVLGGGTPSPHLQAAARSAYNAQKATGLHAAIAQRKAAIASYRAPKKFIARAALAGGLVAANHPQFQAPPTYQLTGAIANQENQ